MFNIIMRKRVRFFPVNGIISNFHLLLRHAEWNAEHVFNEAHNKRGPYDVPTHDEKAADDLEPDLFAITVDAAAGVAVAEGCDAVHCCEDAGSDAAD